MQWEVIEGDCLDVLATLPDQSVQCCITSPPYWGLRDYGVDGQLGLEPTPGAYVDRMVEVFREVRRVLRDDGTLWLNLGDSYNGSGAGGGTGERSPIMANAAHQGKHTAQLRAPGLKPKDLVGIPWRVAFALQADGWYLRSDIIWAKPNPMPESVTDRPTKAHEYVFLLTKRARYYYDAEAVREELVPWNPKWGTEGVPPDVGSRGGRPLSEHPTEYATKPSAQTTVNVKFRDRSRGRNRRTVWTIPTRPFPGAHFAVFPPDLVIPMVDAGCPEGGTVLDPFAGSGTTGIVAVERGRSFIGVELNPEYADMARARCTEATRQERLDFDAPKAEQEELWQAKKR